MAKIRKSKIDLRRFSDKMRNSKICQIYKNATLKTE